MFERLAWNAKEDYTKIGSELLAFDESEAIAAPIIRRLGYEPGIAGKAFLVVASDWGNAMRGEAVKRGIRGASRALKLPT